MITRALTEKLQLFADLAESAIGPEDAASRSRLLLRGDTPDLQQGEALLKGAITEGTSRRRASHPACSAAAGLSRCSSSVSVENLQNLLQSRGKEEGAAPRQEDGSGSGHLPRRAVTFGGYDSSPAILSKSAADTRADPGEWATSEPLCCSTHETK